MSKGTVENAKIENVFLGIIEEKGFLDCTLYLYPRCVKRKELALAV